MNSWPHLSLLTLSYNCKGPHPYNGEFPPRLPVWVVYLMDGPVHLCVHAACLMLSFTRKNITSCPKRPCLQLRQCQSEQHWVSSLVLCSWTGIKIPKYAAVVWGGCLSHQGYLGLWTEALQDDHQNLVPASCQVQHSSEVTKNAEIHSSRVHGGLATYKIGKLVRGCV